MTSTKPPIRRFRPNGLSSKVSRRLVAVLAVPVVAMATVVAGPASPAAAGECTIEYGSLLCGKVKNIGSVGVRIANDWTTKTPSTWIYSGQSSPYKDTDGIYIPVGYDLQLQLCSSYWECGWKVAGPGWYKITNNFNTYQVKMIRE